MDTLTLIEQTFGPLQGKRLLDIGCGGGSLVAALAARGALATGIDPAVPESNHALIRAGAENLPFAGASFDGAIFQNALHHVPPELMSKALIEAARVVGPGRTVIVTEPLAEGSFFAALLSIEDETAVRAAAQSAIKRAIETGLVRLAAQHDWVRESTFETIEPFLNFVLAADATRRHTIDTNRAAIVAAFEAAAERTDAGAYRLAQPIRADVLTAA